MSFISQRGKEYSETAQTLLRAAQTMHAMKAYLPPLARLLMSSLFIWDGIVQLRDPSGTAKYLANVHVPIPDVAVWISIVFHLLTGLGILEIQPRSLPALYP